MSGEIAGNAIAYVIHEPVMVDVQIPIYMTIQGTSSPLAATKIETWSVTMSRWTT